MSCSVHDVAEIETAGVPAVIVASDQFDEAAAAQGSALGTNPTVVYVPHPIQNRTDDELHGFADEVVNQLIAMLTSG